jgi:hypothetical protein
MHPALRSPRTLVSWGLLGYTGLYLFFRFLRWVSSDDFTLGSANSLWAFTSIVELALPVVAALVAIKISPALTDARVIATVALIEYAVAAFLAVITFLVGLGALDHFDGIGITEYLLLGLARIALVGIAGYVTYGLFTGVGGTMPSRRTARPTPPPPPPAA